MSAPSLPRQILSRLGRGGGSANRLILRAAAVVGLCTLGVKLVAAVKETAIAAAFGVGDAVDAFVIALLLPAFVVALIGNSCNGALIPAYIATREREGPEAAQRLLSQTSLVSLGLFVAVAALLGLAGPLALPWLAPGFDEAKLALTRQLLYLSLPQVVLSGVATIWMAVLNARERFALGALAPAAVPVVSIAALLLVGRGPTAIYVLTAAMSAGYLVQLAVLGLALRRQGVGLLPRWHGGGPALWEVIGQYWPLLAGGLLVNTTPLVDRAFAAMLPAGSVAALNYASKIAALIIGLTTMALSTALIPYLAKLVARADWGGVRHSLRTYTWLILAATIPLSLALALGSELIVGLIYQRGLFTAEDTAMVARVQAMYMVQIPFYTLHILFVRLISALRANKVLLWGTLINLVLNIAFDLILLRLMGLPGIALANTAVYAAKLAFVATAGYWLLRRAERAFEANDTPHHANDTPHHANDTPHHANDSPSDASIPTPVGDPLVSLDQDCTVSHHEGHEAHEGARDALPLRPRLSRSFGTAGHWRHTRTHPLRGLRALRGKKLVAHLRQGGLVGRHSDHEITRLGSAAQLCQARNLAIRHNHGGDPLDLAPTAAQHQALSSAQRITLVISSLRAGGAERVMSLMANHWAEAGRDVTLLTFSGPGAAPFYPLHSAVTWRPLGIAGASGGIARALGNNARRLATLRAAIVASRPDAVISFIDRANVLTLLATVGLRLPVVVSERIDPRHSVLGRSWRLLRHLTYPLAARLVVQTGPALACFPPSVRRRGVVIPNPVQRPPGADTPLPRAPGERTLLAMGRLYPQKGFDTLLRAFARVAPARPAWSLELWGEGPLRGELEALRDRLGLAGRVRLPGLTPRPGAAMAASDLFALSSRYEGFPNVLCEAMACGLPAVSFDCPSGPGEIVRHGVDSLLVPAGDGAAFAAALAHLMDDEGERRRLAARAPDVLDRYSTTKVMELWDALLHETTQSAFSSSSARSTTAERSAS